MHARTAAFALASTGKDARNEMPAPTTSLAPNARADARRNRALVLAAAQRALEIGRAHV